MPKAFGKNVNTLPGLRAATTEALARDADAVVTQSGLTLRQLLAFASGETNVPGSSRAGIKAAVDKVHTFYNPDIAG